MSQNIGLGKLGYDPTPKKKFRWAFNLIEHLSDKIVHHEAFFIKLHYHPKKPEFAEFKPDLSHLKIKDEEHRKKLEKQCIKSSSFLDSENQSFKFFDFYRFFWDASNFDNSSKEFYWSNWGASLTMYNGCGMEVERWHMNRISPVSVFFGEPDYSNSEEVEMEAIIIFDEIEPILTPTIF